MRLAAWTLAVLIAVLLGYLIVDQWLPAGQGSLVVTSDPRGAEVWVDLKPTHFKTPGQFDGLPAGKHSVIVKLDTLEPLPAAQVVETKKGHTDTVHFRLVPPQRAALPVPPPSDRLPDLPPIQEDSARKASPPPLVSKRLERPDTLAAVGKQRQTPPGHTEIPGVMEPSPAPGVLEIATSVAGATVFVNDQEQPGTSPLSLKLPVGTYVLRVELKGYTSDPPDQTVSILRSSAIQSVFFTLTETQTRRITVETSPFAAKIYINGAPLGVGKVSVPRDYGSYTVSFADSEGWRTPESVQVTLTPSQPQPQVKGVYERLFHAGAQVVDGKVVTENGMQWEVGAYFEEDGKRPSVSLGPRIRPIPDSQKSGWELAEGDPNRNPTGGDYVEFKFTLPSDADLKAPLNLRLYLYRSTRHYAFSLSGRAEVVVTVNGHRFLDGYRPQYGTEVADQDRYEEWALTGMLVRGENRIMVRSGERNTLFNYLWKIEIL
jgi:hypothetical protein